MNRLLLALALFLFVWPVVTGLSIAFDAAGLDWPVAARTFATSAILVPSMVFAIVPVLTRILAPRGARSWPHDIEAKEQHR